LALIDAPDINQSLYAKLEYPAFIAVLTTNGRRFVDYLRASGLKGARDNQFLSLSVRPHVQIEIYSSFALENGQAQFGPFTDLLAIGFNAYLDYYHLTCAVTKPGRSEFRPVIRLAEMTLPACKV
jgi:hypothetical protein